MSGSSRTSWGVAGAVVAVAFAGMGVPAAHAVEGTVPEGAVAAATVRLDIAGDGSAAAGGAREMSCSGALIGPSWVISAASCFADAATGAPVSAGAPRSATTATVGRVDLTGTAGSVVAVDRVVPHSDRDVVLVHLASRVTGVTPVRLAAATPTVGETLTVSGYGRTADVLVPDVAHAATYTVSGVGAAVLDIGDHGSGAAICKGDAGGPALRATTGGGVELVAIHHTAFQGGCLGATSTRRDATETRVDDLRAWISSVVLPPAAPRGADSVGVRASATWYLNAQQDSSAAEMSFQYGDPGGTALVGDWNGDGIDTVGLWRDGIWYLNDQNDSSAPERTFRYGDAHHTPVVGDWNGDGIDTVGVRTGAWWHLNDQNDASAADRVFPYGDAHHTPVVGDWNGDGIDTVGVWIGSVWHLNDQNDPSAAERVFRFGDPHHTPIVGDWNGDGVDTVGVWFAGAWDLNDQNDSSAADRVFRYGEPGDVPLTGSWVQR